MRYLPVRGARNVRRGRIVTLAVALAGLAVPLSIGSATAVTPTPFNTNLVQNPGAEAGSASSDGNSGVPIPHWGVISDSKFTVVAYGTSGGFPTTAEGHRIGGGHQFFTTGAFDTVFGECDDANQNIFIKGRGAAIDSGHVKVVLSVRAGTYDSQTDTAHVNLYFGDGTNNPLGGAHVQPQTHTNGRLNLVSVSKILPRHTRQIEVRLWISNAEGYCDAYFDNVRVKLVSV
jgi:hypothetical protein